MRALSILLAVCLIALTGCATSAPPPKPIAARGDSLQRVVIVGSGESKFTMVHASPEATRTFDGAKIVSSVINSSAQAERVAAAESQVGQMSPRSVVADAFARRLQASGHFADVRAVEREPVGDERRDIDAIVRVTVPAWGLVRVREGKPDLLAGFADVRAQMVVRGTGTVVWEHEEDVTHGERLPLQALTGDKDLARQGLLDVLERAGQRMANEYLYARGAGR